VSSVTASGNDMMPQALRGNYLKNAPTGRGPVVLYFDGYLCRCPFDWPSCRAVLPASLDYVDENALTLVDDDIVAVLILIGVVVAILFDGTHTVNVEVFVIS